MKIKYLNILIILLFSLSVMGNVNAANENTNLLEEKYSHLHDMGFEGIIVKLDVSKLKHGDYIQLRNFKDEALVYSMKDSGYVYFGDTYGSYYCSEEDFNKWYTGYALLTN